MQLPPFTAIAKLLQKVDLTNSSDTYYGALTPAKLGRTLHQRDSVYQA